MTPNKRKHIPKPPPARPLNDEEIIHQRKINDLIARGVMQPVTEPSGGFSIRNYSNRKRVSHD
jgi:hypothetical protein